MAQTALFIRPMARKKRVPMKYAPNSFRVISVEAESTEPLPMSTYSALMSKTNVIGQPAELTPSGDHRHNRPNPLHVGFLSQDVALLNEPICDVYTTATRADQRLWWPRGTSQEVHEMPPHRLDTTVRADFQFRGEEVPKSTRHGSNPNTTPALGTVPVNFLREPSGQQRFWKEGISYEHQYNSREDPSYRIRANRQGNFVWDRFGDHEVDRILQYYGYALENGGHQGPINLSRKSSHLSGVTSRHQSTTMQGPASRTRRGSTPKATPDDAEKTPNDDYASRDQTGSGGNVELAGRGTEDNSKLPPVGN